MKKFDETTSSPKTSCQTHKTCVSDSYFSGYGWFQVLIISNAYLNTLLLLHLVFMLSMVKMGLKGEVGGHALNSHGNYIVDHGKVIEKSWNRAFEFLSEPWMCFQSFSHF